MPFVKQRESWQLPHGHVPEREALPGSRHELRV
jgi:hypothetical protein